MSATGPRLLCLLGIILALFNSQGNEPRGAPPGEPVAKPAADPVINPELALVVPDVPFATVRPAALLAAPGGKEVVAAWSAFGPNAVPRIEKRLGQKLEDIARITAVGLGPEPDNFLIGYNSYDGYTIVTAKAPLDRTKLLAYGWWEAKTQQAAEYNGKTYHVLEANNKEFGLREDWAIYFHDDRTAVYGFLPGIKKAIDQGKKPKTNGPMAKALADAGGQLLAFGTVGHDPGRPRPGDLPADQADLATVKHWLVVGRVGEKGLELDLRATFADEKTAGGAEKALSEPKSRTALCPGASNGAKAVLEAAVVSRAGVDIVLAARPVQGKDALADTLAGLFEIVKADPVNKPHEMVNLLRLSRAFIPPPGRTPTASQAVFASEPIAGPRPALHSWRVALLPRLGEEDLYKQIRLTEPWDSDHNKQFHDKMPKVFELPSRAAPPGQTYFQTFVGPLAIFTGQHFGRNFHSIVDGTANTLLLAEAATAVNWMEPKEIPFEVKPDGFPNNKLGDPKSDRFLVAFADGRVQRLSRKLTPLQLQALITASGREPPFDP